MFLNNTLMKELFYILNLNKVTIEQVWRLLLQLFFCAFQFILHIVLLITKTFKLCLEMNQH